MSTMMAAATAAPIAHELPGEAAEVLRLLISAPTNATGSASTRSEARPVLDEEAGDVANAAAAALAGDLSNTPRMKFPASRGNQEWARGELLKSML